MLTGSPPFAQGNLICRQAPRRSLSRTVPSRVRNRARVRTDRSMPDTNALPQPDPMAELVDTYGVVDAKGLAAMIGLSHRTVMVYAAEAAWRTGHLPRPLYVGRSVRTRDGRGRRWRRATVRVWLAAVETERTGGVA